MVCAHEWLRCCTAARGPTSCFEFDIACMYTQTSVLVGPITTFSYQFTIVFELNDS